MCFISLRFRVFKKITVKMTGRVLTSLRLKNEPSIFGVAFLGHLHAS